MTLAPLQPGPLNPPARTGTRRIEPPGKPQDGAFRRLLTAARGLFEDRAAAMAPPSRAGDGADNGRARIFNEDGFFGRVRPLSPNDCERAAAPVQASALGPAPGSPLAGEGLSRQQASVPKLGTAHLPDSGAGVRRGAAGGERAGIARTAVPVRHADAATAQAPPVPGRAAFEAEVKAAAEGAAPARARRDPSAAEGLLNLRVRLAPDSENLDLSVRLGRLSREQRARLRLEIAHLVQRHGFGVAAIRLNGEIEPGPWI